MSQIISIVFFSIVMNSVAQTENSLPLYISYDFGLGAINSITFSESFWQKIAPSFQNPNDSLGFNQNYSAGIISSGFHQLSFEKEIKAVYLNSKKLHQTLGFSLGFAPQINSSKSFGKQETIFYDTLTSSQTGNQTYLYTTNWNYIGLDYSASRIFFGINMKTFSNDLRRISGGLGFDFNYFFTSNANLSFQTSSYKENSDIYSSEQEFESTFTRIENAPIMHGLIMKLPLFLNYRLSKKETSFLSKTWISAQFTPILDWTFYDKNQWLNNGFWGGIGVKVKI